MLESSGQGTDKAWPQDRREGSTSGRSRRGSRSRSPGHQVRPQDRREGSTLTDNSELTRTTRNSPDKFLVNNSSDPIVDLTLTEDLLEEKEKNVCKFEDFKPSLLSSRLRPKYSKFKEEVFGDIEYLPGNDVKDGGDGNVKEKGRRGRGGGKGVGPGRPLGSLGKGVPKKKLVAELEKTTKEKEELEMKLKEKFQPVVITPSIEAKMTTDSLKDDSSSDEDFHHTQGSTLAEVLKDRKKNNIRDQMRIGAQQETGSADTRYLDTALDECLNTAPGVSWEDIKGLEGAKKSIKETVVLPLLNPKLFKGVREPARGIMLFGPPGTGKTMIARCIATEVGGADGVFFNITAASIGSKYVGESEKIVRALFTLARAAPSTATIFIDEMESILCERSGKEGDTARKIKTEFLAQMDGMSTNSKQPLVIGCTNRPYEIDEAIRRRLPKRLYVPLPDEAARKDMISLYLKEVNVSLTQKDMLRIARLTDLYSGSDMRNLCKEASMGPIREIPIKDISSMDPEKVRHVQMSDFVEALNSVKPSVNAKQLQMFEEFCQQFGAKL